MSDLKTLETISKSKSFGGWQLVCRHRSLQTKTPMRFSLYLPPQAATQKTPLLWWLSGLTCSEENFIFKSGAQRYAAECGVAIAGPDTSPRGANIPGEDDADDFGAGAGFYVDAEVQPWATNYRMFSYVAKELPQVLAANFSQLDMGRQAIMGHSMGGHGALIMALKNPAQYQSVSAFAPICNLAGVEWGQKALTGYVGDDRQKWAEWDATMLIRAGAKCPPILVDQGAEDEFLPQLLPSKLQQAAAENGQPLTMRMQAEYDHSYYFVATFIGEHIRRHAQTLNR